MMSLPVKCKFCDYSFSVHEQFAGKSVKCPQCSGAILIQSQIDFADELDKRCNFCGHSVPKDEEKCPECQNPIKSEHEIPVQPLPDVYRRPAGSVPSSLPIGKIIFSLFILAMGAFVFFFYQKSRQTTPLHSLFPKDTHFMLVANLEKIYRVSSQETVDQVSKWMEHFKLWKELGVDCKKDMKTFCLLVGGKVETPQIALICQGKFDPERFENLAGMNLPAKNQKKIQEEYEGYAIVKYRQKEQTILFTLLQDDHLVLSMPEGIGAIKNVIDVYSGKAKPLDLGGRERAWDSFLWHLHGQVPRDASLKGFSEKVPQEYHPLLTMNSISVTIEGDEKKASFELRAKFDSAEAPDFVTQRINEAMAKMKEVCAGLREPYNQGIVELLEQFQVRNLGQEFVLSFNSSEEKQERLRQVLKWALLEQGFHEIDSLLKWKEIEALPENEVGQKLSLLKRFVANPHYGKSPFYPKATELLKQLREEVEEKAASNVFQELKKGIASEEPAGFLLLWGSLNKYPDEYKDTSVFSKVTEELEKSERKAFEVIERLRQSFEQVKSTKEFDGFQGSTETWEMLLSHRALLNEMVKKSALFEDKKILQTLASLYEEIKKEKERVAGSLEKQREERRQSLGREVQDFLTTEMPRSIAERDMRKVHAGITDLQKKCKELEESSLEATLENALNDLKGIGNLFRRPIYEGLKSKKNQKIQISLIDKRYISGAIEKLEKTQFVFRLHNNEVETISFSKLNGKSLGKYIPESQKSGELLYYLGMLFWYEGEKDYAKRYLKESLEKKYGQAAALLEKMGQ